MRLTKGTPYLTPVLDVYCEYSEENCPGYKEN